MNRRDFLTSTSLLTATTFMSACGSGGSEEAEATQPKPKGTVTLYYEFKIAGPEVAKMVQNVRDFAHTLDSTPGFLSLSLKEMIGDSTMVNNFPIQLKGVLKSAYIDGALQKRRPFVFALLIRFDGYDNLVASNAKEWFNATIKPQLFMYNPATTPPTKTPVVLDYYQGIYKTVAAGDAQRIYTTQEQIVEFLKNQKDVASPQYRPIPADGTSNDLSITVINHVAIHAQNTDIVNQKATALLTTAQQTYQPSSNPDDGLPGTLDVDNFNYQKPLSTEILQNAYEFGGVRDYLFHGVWKAVADHENSHIDPRFRKAAAPVGAFVIAGPWEPFYQTSILHNKM